MGELELNRSVLQNRLSNTVYWVVVTLEGKVTCQIGCPPHCASQEQYVLCESSSLSVYVLDGYCLVQVKKFAGDAVFKQLEPLTDLEFTEREKFVAALQERLPESGDSLITRIVAMAFRPSCLSNQNLLSWRGQTVTTLSLTQPGRGCYPADLHPSMGWWPCQNLFWHYVFPVFNHAGAVVQLLLIGPLVKTEPSVINSLDQLKSVRSQEFKKFSDDELARCLSRVPHFTEIQTMLIEMEGFMLARSLSEELIKNGLVEGKLCRKSVARKINAFYAHQTLARTEKLARFFPGFTNRYRKTPTGSRKQISLNSCTRTTEFLFVDKIINDYQRRLKEKSQSEHSWQTFLKEHFLIFCPNYENSLEKQNLSLHGKFPDFLLIDANGYLDIFEIKRPDTNLLKKDESRGNYYWDAEISKALAQVETYIHLAEKNSGTLREEIKKRKGLEIKVLKPRGFIVAGTREQFKDEIMEDSFRLLNNSQMNVQIIRYDALLESLKSFLKRLKNPPRENDWS
jgi:hypothetical protein